MYKRLLSDSAIYGLGGILIRGLGFFTLPIYTRIFSPEDYGIITMLSTIGGIISIFMNAGLDSAQSYFFMRSKNQGDIDSKIIVTSISYLRLFIGVIIGILVFLVSSIIVDLFFPERIPITYIWMITVSVFFANLISQSLDIFRLTYKPWQYMSLTSFQSVINIALILCFAYLYNMGVEGYILGNVAGALIALVIAWFSTKKYRCSFKWDPDLWLSFVRYGLPLIPAGLMMWIMQISDRWFVTHMLGIYETGLYAVGAKFAMLMALAVETFRKAWWPIAMDMMHKEDGPAFFRVVTSWYVVLGTLAAVLLTILSPYLLLYLTPKEYHESWKIVGILCWSSILYGFYQLSTLGLFYSRKTKYTLYIQSVGAILNIMLNYLLIPVMGVYGAALATISALFLSNIISMFISNRYYKIDWNWLVIVPVIFLGFVFIVSYTKGWLQ